MYVMNNYELFNPSMESSTPDGVKKDECEYEIYGTLTDMAVLASAERSELQEQWGVYIEKVSENASGGTLRVRMVDNVNFVFTSKVKLAGSNEEVEFDSSSDLFNHFKRFATAGMQKRRYFFPVEGSDFVYEVDVFFAPDGSPIPHVKIDLEIDGPGGIDSLPDLPFDLDNMVVIPPGRKSPEHLAFVRDLYNKYYTMPNQFVEPAAVVLEVASLEDGAVTVMQRLKQLAIDGLNIEGNLAANGSELEADIKQHLLELGNMVTRLYAEENYP
jgi:CYTH domain-containing protein